MFDQLHDPNPPEATSRHLAVVGLGRERGDVGDPAVLEVVLDEIVARQGLLATGEGQQEQDGGTSHVGTYSCHSDAASGVFRGGARCHNRDFGRTGSG